MRGPSSRAANAGARSATWPAACLFRCPRHPAGRSASCRTRSPRVPFFRRSRRPRAHRRDGSSAQGITSPFPIQAADPPRRPRRSRRLRPGPHRLGQDPRLRHPDGRHASARPSPAAPRASCSSPPASWPRRSRDELALLAGPRGRGSSRPSTAASASASSSRRCAAASTSSSPAPVASPTSSNRGDVKLDDVEFVVVDEADRMADMGFLPEVRKPARRHRRATARRCCSRPPSTVTSTCWSATTSRSGPPRGGRRPGRRRQRRPPLLERRARPSACQRCAELIARAGPTIVFCRTKHGADRLAQQLEQRRRARRRHPRRPLAGPARAGPRLVPPRPGPRRSSPPTSPPAASTSTTSPCVVHFDPPADDKDYVHRSGRTGRAGADGVVVTFVAPELRKDVTRMQKILKMPQGITSPDADGLPVLERPSRKARRGGSAPRGRTPGPFRRTSPRQRATAQRSSRWSVGRRVPCCQGRQVGRSICREPQVPP